MRHFLIALLLVATSSSVALAEGPEGAPPPGQEPPPGQSPPPGQPPPDQQYEVQPTPTYEQQPQGQQAQPQYQEQQPATGQEGRGIEYGAHLLVPIWLSLTDSEGESFVNPGIGIQGRIGWEFGGGLTIELSIGAMINGYDDRAADAIGEDGFSNVWIGGGARYMFFNPSAFVPFIGAGLKINFWNICRDDGLGGTVCSGESAATLGFNGIVGAAYEISPYIAIEAGLDANVTLPGDVFEESEFYISPFLGGTLYF